MSESGSAAVEGPVVGNAGLSAGAMLRSAREAAGLHVAALAVSMKVPVKKLEALEADRLDLLPDAVFVRALASSMCRALRIDSTPILQKLPQTAVPRLDTEERGINAPFHTPGDSRGVSVFELLGRPSVLMVLVLMAGALVLVFLPEVRVGPAVTEVASAVVPLLPANDVQPAAVAIPAPVDVVAPVAAPAPVTTPPAGTTAGAEPLTTAPAPAPATPVAIVPAGPDVAGVSAGVVRFSARASSWIEVTDARSNVQLRKTLQAGEVASASGTLPLAVVVGRADATEVLVRGKPLSLTDIARDNVARFEVK